MFKTFFWAQKLWGAQKIWGGIAPDIPPWLQAWSVGCQIVLVLTDASAKLKRGHLKRYTSVLSV